jgi:hypothetical protein
MWANISTGPWAVSDAGQTVRIVEPDRVPFLFDRSHGPVYRLVNIGPERLRGVSMTPSLIPTPRPENHGFVVTSPSSHYPAFAAIMLRGIPDLHTLDTGNICRGTDSRGRTTRIS